tara:strand:- start:737 stop:991 length:255 start_codon:yes stop_codon:yes gene_type:complete
MSVVNNIELEEIISFYAKRGDTEMLSVLRQVQGELEKNIDPDYETESSEESEVSESDTESELVKDLVEEEVEVKKTCDGHCSIA